MCWWQRRWLCKVDSTRHVGALAADTGLKGSPTREGMERGVPVFHLVELSHCWHVACIPSLLDFRPKLLVVFLAAHISTLYNPKLQSTKRTVPSSSTCSKVLRLRASRRFILMPLMLARDLVAANAGLGFAEVVNAPLEAGRHELLTALNFRASWSRAAAAAARAGAGSVSVAATILAGLHTAGLLCGLRAAALVKLQYNMSNK